MAIAWYALRVRPNSAKAATDSLAGTGHVVLNPTFRQMKRWSDRLKEVETPLFNGYVFCHMDIQQRLSVLKTPGVIDVVRFGKTFIPVPDVEIDYVQKLVTSKVFSLPYPYLCVGDRVVLDRGPLAGVEGLLLKRNDERSLVVSVHLLQRSIVTHIDVDWVRPDVVKDRSIAGSHIRVESIRL